MASLSVTAFAAILTGVSVTMVGLLVVLALRLRGAIRTHKRLLRDLEERGVIIAQTRAQTTKNETITRPRAVLRRNKVLPFNSTTGWDALPSTENINAPATSVPHYAPAKPAGYVTMPGRLSWPFSTRRPSSKAIHMRKIRVPVLSTVIESPKPSPLVPILSRSSISGDQPSSKKSGSRPTSDQSLLQHHPAFRNTWQENPSEATTAPQPIRRSLTAKPASRAEPRVRPNRSRSVTEVPLTTKDVEQLQSSRSPNHGRSVSMCSQSSGVAPDAPIPPLPLEVARLKSQERRKSLLNRSPSHVSVSSYESGHSSILATQSSPIMPRSRNLRLHHGVAKKDWRHSMVVGPRPIRDTLVLHGKNPTSRSSIKSSAARFSVVSPSSARQSQAESRSSTITNASSTNSVKVKTAESVTLSKVSSPSCSPVTVRSPPRRPGTQVTSYGSPEERPKTSYRENNTILERQLSQTSTQASSTRSSNGNPFQWDPSPLSSGKPSAMKGSPSARKGHRRQNCVRISLAPTILGPRSRSPSPSIMKGIQEESPNASSEDRRNVGLGFSNTRSLPRPPSCSTFDPDLKLDTTSIRASLTSYSPSLEMTPYEQPHTEGSNGAGNEDKRASTSSFFSISTFPNPYYDSITSPPTFSLSRPSSEYDREEVSPVLPSSPFEPLLSDSPSSAHEPLLANEYDPEYSSPIFETPTSSPTAKKFASPISTIPEEPSIIADDTMEYERLQDEDSPPCSPKTLRPNSSRSPKDTDYPQYSVQFSTIPEEESFLETIDPAILSNDAFSTLNSEFEPNICDTKPAKTPRQNTPLPESPETANVMLEPLLEAAFGSSPTLENEGGPQRTYFDSSMQSPRSSSSSVYSSPSPRTSLCPSPTSFLPSSPRPRHAKLPTPSLNFSDMPSLAPPLCGPRGSPPRPLRSSIAKLRRMNSDAEQNGKDKAGRAERRYLRLGREDSIALPGEESYLDELDDDTEESKEGITLNEAKSRRLVGSLLDWEEEATILDLEDKKVDEATGAGAQDSTAASDPKQPDEQKRGRDEGEPHIPSSPPAPSSPPLPRSDIDRSSSIWEHGEKFWQSTPPRPAPPPPPQVSSPNKPRNNNFLPLASSPLSTPRSGPKNRTSTPTTTTATTTRRKRAFSVAKDEEVSPTQVENHFRFSHHHRITETPPRSSDTTAGAPNSNNNGGNGSSPADARRNNRMSGNRYRKRSALAGIGTPNVNVRIQVQAPSGEMGTPGSLYDNDGFLRG